jgi:hypothetical protein
MEEQQQQQQQIPVEIREKIRQMQGENQYWEGILGREKSTTVPEEILSRLNSTLRELESVTGRFYEVRIRCAGTNEEMVIGALDQRNGYTISHMCQKYEALNGWYPSIAAIKERVIQLKYGDTLLPGGAHWQCTRCGKSSERQENGFLKANKARVEGWCDVCQFCSHWPNFDWSSIGFDVASQLVYSSDGGTLSVCNPLGKIAIVPAK